MIGGNLPLSGSVEIVGTRKGHTRHLTCQTHLRGRVDHVRRGNERAVCSFAEVRGIGFGILGRCLFRRGICRSVLYLLED